MGNVPPTVPTFSSWVRIRRSQLGWSQATLAERARLSRDAVKRIERGTEPRWTTAIRLLHALDTPHETLVRLTASGATI